MTETSSPEASMGLGASLGQFALRSDWLSDRAPWGLTEEVLRCWALGPWRGRSGVKDVAAGDSGSPGPPQLLPAWPQPCPSHSLRPWPAGQRLEGHPADPVAPLTTDHAKDPCHSQASSNRLRFLFHHSKCVNHTRASNSTLVWVDSSAYTTEGNLVEKWKMPFTWMNGESRN